MLFGFSTGVLSQHMDTKEALRVIKQIGCQAVELGFIRKARLEAGCLDVIKKEDLDDFKYVSFHAPNAYYDDNEETWKIFNLIKRLHDLRPLNLVVFHPDNVRDIEVFKKLSFPVTFENMDDKKSFGKTPEDLEKLLNVDASFHMVLDINHIKANDLSLKLLNEFYQRLGDRISEIHVSGLGHEYPHIPLFQTKEKEILTAIRDKSVPIICESRLAPDEIEQEKEYIKKIVGK